MEKKIVIRFGLGWGIFFILLEGSTVPLVAMSNHIALQNLAYMGIMGFGVAFICVAGLIKLLYGVLLQHSRAILGIAAEKISGLWSISLLAGILLMIMFVVQDLLYAHGWGDFRVGFASAFVSVSLTLFCYELASWLSGWAIVVVSQQVAWQVHFRAKDILLLTLMFSAYEYIVCPLTSLWVPLHDYRLVVAISSGLAGGAIGGTLLYLMSRFLRLRPCLTLRQVQGKFS